MNSDETEKPVVLDNSDSPANMVEAAVTPEEQTGTPEEQAVAPEEQAAASEEQALTPEMVISLGKYRDDDYITKIGLAEAFGCTDRTLQRMVERLDIPPPMPLGKRKVWIVGKLRAWIAQAAERQEAQALKAAGLRYFS